MKDADLTSRKPSDNIVEIRDVHYSVNGRPIFAGLNIAIQRGRITAIMGPSGTGKTTLLRLITGQIHPGSGQVIVDGDDVARLSRSRLYAMRQRMGMLFQNGALLTDMSVFDNVAFPLREHTDLPESLIAHIVLTKLQAVGLRGAWELMPAELSGGMARRVALARSIANDPAMLIYDEPFAGLDPISLNVIAQLIRRLNDALQGTSIVVTYDVSESLKVVDYAYLIHGGRVEAEGTSAALMASEEPFVVQFLHAQPTGPVPFHMVSKQPYRQDLGLKPAA